MNKPNFRFYVLFTCSALALLVLLHRPPVPASWRYDRWRPVLVASLGGKASQEHVSQDAGALQSTSSPLKLEIVAFSAGTLEQNKKEKEAGSHPLASTSSSASSASSEPTAPSAVTKVVVMAKIHAEDTSWVADQTPDWQSAIYTVDDSYNGDGDATSLHTTANKGREANAYLTYILQNYLALPDVIVFLHAHEKGWPVAWHTDTPGYSNPKALQTLRLESVRRDGYLNLRCIHTPGCPVEIQPMRVPPNTEHTSELAYPAAWKYMFPGEEMPSAVGVPCCSQFAVSREQVLKRPIGDYQRYARWLAHTELEDAVSGRVLEYMWHIIFGKDAVSCPDLGTCYCNVYGIGC